MQARTPEAIGRAALAVLDRSKATARNRGVDARLLILGYVLQRFLHRLSVSSRSSEFVLKGGMMMPLLGAGNRPTQDIDTHSHIDLDEAGAREVMREICLTPPVEEDGVVFDPDGMTVDEIRDGLMPGFRVSISATVHPAGGRPSIFSVKVDLCFGDVITPEPVFAELESAIKGFDPIRVSVYPWPTVVAEKLHALARHGESTSRMKDLYDIALISRSVPVGGADLVAAISATFRQWGDTDPLRAAALLTPAFADLVDDQWRRFVARKAPGALDMGDARAVVEEIRGFALPALEAAAAGEGHDGDWVPGVGWATSPASAPGR